MKSSHSKLINAGALRIRCRSRFPCGQAKLEGYFRCPSCGKLRWIVSSNAGRKTFTKRCASCAGSINVIQAQNPKYKKYGPDNPKYKRGYFITPAGYREVALSVNSPLRNFARKDGRIFQHRLVMAIFLNRKLESWEHVHHKNQNRQDNRLENLELVSATEHVTITSLIRRVKELEKEVKRTKIKLTAASRTRTIL